MNSPSSQLSQVEVLLDMSNNQPRDTSLPSNPYKDYRGSMKGRHEGFRMLDIADITSQSTIHEIQILSNDKAAHFGSRDRHQLHQVIPVWLGHMLRWDLVGHVQQVI